MRRASVPALTKTTRRRCWLGLLLGIVLLLGAGLGIATSIAATPHAAAVKRAERTAKEGETLYNQKRFTEAAALWHQSYQLDPLRVIYLYSAARAELAAGLLPEAAKHFAEFLERCQTDLTPRQRQSLAEFVVLAKRYQGDIAAQFAKARERPPEVPAKVEPPKLEPPRAEPPAKRVPPPLDPEMRKQALLTLAELLRWAGQVTTVSHSGEGSYRKSRRIEPVDFATCAVIWDEVEEFQAPDDPPERSGRRLTVQLAALATRSLRITALDSTSPAVRVEVEVAPGGLRVQRRINAGFTAPTAGAQLQVVLQSEAAATELRKQLEALATLCAPVQP